MTSGSDLFMYLSNATASGGWTASSDNTKNYGGYVSTTYHTSSNELRTISSLENTLGISNYKCIFVNNLSLVDTFTDVRVYKTSEYSGGWTTSIAADPTSMTSRSYAASQQALLVASDTTAPPEISVWSTASTYATGIQLGTIPPLCVRAFWMKYSGTAGVAYKADYSEYAIGGNVP